MKVVNLNKCVTAEIRLPTGVCPKNTKWVPPKQKFGIAWQNSGWYVRGIFFSAPSGKRDDPYAVDRALNENEDLRFHKEEGFLLKPYIKYKTEYRVVYEYFNTSKEAISRFQKVEKFFLTKN